MDDRLHRLERAFAAGGDPQVAIDLSRASLRAGRPARALTVARAVPDAPERDAAARALAGRIGFAFTGVIDGFDHFHRGGVELVLVPGGAFLEDGDHAWSSSLAPGGSRSGLRRVVVPDLVVSVDAWTGAAAWAEAREAADRLGGRLPSPAEWKKVWRGGLFLDGDAVAARPHPHPDQIGPWGPGEPPSAGAPVVSPYGVRFAGGACEWTSRPGAGMGYSGGRYRLPLDTEAHRRGRLLVWRMVADVPPDP